MEYGGAEKLVALYCQLQKAAGWQTEVHCLHSGGALLGELERQGVECHIHGPGNLLLIVSRLYAAWHQKTPDVVHCHNAAASIYGAAVARAVGCPVVVVTRHGLVEPPPITPLRRELKFWMMSGFYDRIVAVCEATRQNLTHGPCANPEIVVTIRNGASPAPRASSPDPQIRKQGFTLVTVGRLAREKNYATLLEAVALARPSVPDLSVWMVGGGVEERALRNLARRLAIEDFVWFVGERADVGDWLAAADLFVLSSLTEGLPMSLVEAMAAGLPAIVTDVGGMPEVVREAGAGAIVQPRNARRLADTIIDFANRRCDLPDLRRRAREWYERHGTPQVMCEDYLRLYRECPAASRV